MSDATNGHAMHGAASTRDAAPGTTPAMRTVRAVLAVGSVMVLVGCMDRDPYRRTDVWRPTGANSTNIAAQVANPNDLIRGQSSGRTNTGPAVLAVDRIVTDQARPLNPGAPAGGGGGGGGGTGVGSGSGAAAAGATQ